MNDRAVEIFRTFLMVVGILLLVIFGSRAAAQARSMKLAGASHKSVFAVGSDIMNVLGFTKADPIVLYEPKPISNHVPVQIQTVEPIAATGSSAAQGANHNQASVLGAAPGAVGQANKDSNSGSNKGTGKLSDTVNNVASNTQKTIKNTTDDFTNLWP